MTAERRRYDIQTRGAKLPKYSFEKKSHRKILMSQAGAHVEKHKQGLKRLMVNDAFVMAINLLIYFFSRFSLEFNAFFETSKSLSQFV